ncbi:hypothetical protein PSACC_01746 [Paramicrosporidium saccamoebae]|uniref:C2H2-type domain-containing protein n=1 Tax=Paramicrosporidium saccamoebae TaxID=1246581 RepID=A0A2H9TL00_9FUNG|nr:hypothetical protein PSACC_01746 [Paramicrosporidium saccamoebae]
MAKLTSPALPVFEDPLVFQAEWLRPTTKGTPRWNQFFETLKTLTALDVCQPPPLRAALARLWVVYLCSGPVGQTFTAGAWLLEQLKLLGGKGTPQACVFAGCAGLVFSEFSSVLLPMAQDCSNSLAKLCSHHMTSPIVAVVASEGLIALTTKGTVFLGNSKTDLAQKCAIPLIESKSSRLRINGMLILANLLTHTFALGTITRKSVKSRVQELLSSVCEEEKDSACTLMAALICFLPNGEPQLTTKTVESWAKVADRQPAELGARILVRMLNYSKEVEKIFTEIVKEHSMSLAIVPDSKKRIWKITFAHLSTILTFLPDIIPHSTLATIVKTLLKSDDEDILNAACPFYLECVRSGVLGINDTELLNLPLRFANNESLSRKVAEYMPLIVRDGSKRHNLLLSIFAQLKGDWTLISSDDPSASLSTFASYARSLSTLLAFKMDNSYDCLYSSAGLFEQIRDWALGILKVSQCRTVKNAGWEILGSLLTSINVLEVSKLISSPNVAGIESISSVDISIGEVAFINRVLTSSSVDTKSAVTSRVPTFSSINTKPASINRVPTSSPMDTETAFINHILKFVVDQWRLCNRVNDLAIGVKWADLQLLCSTTLPLMDTSNELCEIASTVTSRAICSIEATPDTMKLLEDCRRILCGHFRNTSIAGQKYHLSQFNIFVKSSGFREAIFRTVSGLLDGIDFAKKTPSDQTFMLDIMKQVIFPFVCDADKELQCLATVCLGKLVQLVKTREFRDGMLQELIDRSLNEPREEHRRGYIIGIGAVYAAVPENGSQLDISAVMGLLCSLAKDQRSIIVQAAAINALHTVVDARSNAVAPVLTSDIIYLIWQIYMNDPNAVFVDSAVERQLLDSVARTLLVMIEMLGPELNSDTTVARCCRLMVGEFLEYDSRDPTLQSVLFDASTQVLVICQKAESLSALLATICEAFRSRSNCGQALSCFKWLLEYHRTSVLQFVTPALTASLLNLYPDAALPDLDFCAELLFESNFIHDPSVWLALIRDATFMKTVSEAHSGSVVSLDMDTVLLGELSLVEATTQSPLCTLAAVEKVVHMISLFFRSHGHQLTTICTTEVCNQLAADVIRQSLALVMGSNATVGTLRLKLLGLSLASAMVTGCRSLPDPLDAELLFLDSYLSQLVTIYSTACADDNVVIAAESYAALNRLVSFESLRKSWGVHPKVRTLFSKGIETLNGKVEEPADLYVHVLVAASVWLLMSKSSWTLTAIQSTVLDRTLSDCLPRMINRFIGDDLDPLTRDQCPPIISAAIRRNVLESTSTLKTAIPALLFSASTTSHCVTALSDFITWTGSSTDITLALLRHFIATDDMDIFAAVFDNFSTLKTSLQDTNVKTLAIAMFSNILSRGKCSASLLLSAINALCVANLVTDLWSILVQILHSILPSNLIIFLEFLSTTSDPSQVSSVFVALFRDVVLTQSQVVDLCTLIFTAPQTQLCILQVATRIALSTTPPPLLLSLTTTLIRHLLPVERQAVRIWLALLKVEEVRGIAINSLDVFLEYAMVEFSKEKSKILPHLSSDLQNAVAVGGIMVSIHAFQAWDPGSIPGQRNYSQERDGSLIFAQKRSVDEHTQIHAIVWEYNCFFEYISWWRILIFGFEPFPGVRFIVAMGIYRRSRTHKARKELSKKNRLRKRTKDLDQIVEDIDTGRRQVEFDEDLPGGGQFQCVECSRFFISQEVLDEHNKTKPHKKRLRELKTKPYTLEEANAAGGCGLGSCNLHSRLSHPQPPTSSLSEIPEHGRMPQVVWKDYKADVTAAQKDLLGGGRVAVPVRDGHFAQLKIKVVFDAAQLSAVQLARLELHTDYQALRFIQQLYRDTYRAHDPNF